MRKVKKPLEFELKPDNIDVGVRWLTLAIKNIGSETLEALEIQLNSLNSYAISVFGSGDYIPILQPDDEKSLYFQVSARGSGELYVTVDGKRTNEYFSWESGAIEVQVGAEAAQLKSVFAMTAPYPPIGRSLTVEATVQAKREANDLSLEFWIDYPSGNFEQIGKVTLKALSQGETATYTTKVTPEEEGFYRVYAYLYDGTKNIGTQTDTIWVRK